MNTEEWEDPGTIFIVSSLQLDKLIATAFDQDNFVHWGKLYEAKDVNVEWHGMLNMICIRIQL